MESYFHLLWNSKLFPQPRAVSSLFPMHMVSFFPGLIKWTFPGPIKWVSLSVNHPYSAHSHKDIHWTHLWSISLLLCTVNVWQIQLIDLFKSVSPLCFFLQYSPERHYRMVWRMDKLEKTYGPSVWASTGAKISSRMSLIFCRKWRQTPQQPYLFLFIMNLYLLIFKINHFKTMALNFLRGLLTPMNTW